LRKLKIIISINFLAFKQLISQLLDSKDSNDKQMMEHIQAFPHDTI